MTLYYISWCQSKMLISKFARDVIIIAKGSEAVTLCGSPWLCVAFHGYNTPKHFNSISLLYLKLLISLRCVQSLLTVNTVIGLAGLPVQSRVAKELKNALVPVLIQDQRTVEEIARHWVLLRKRDIATPIMPVHQVKDGLSVRSDS